MIYLPTTTAEPPRFRVLYKNSAWNSSGSAASNTDWTPAPVYSAQSPAGGIEVVRLTRAALPGIGECELVWRFGHLLARGGDVVSMAKSFAADAYEADAQGWPTGPGGSVLDLSGKTIRVQVADGKKWRTVWLGRIVRQDDNPVGGASVPMGERRYYGVDLLYACTYTRDRWTHCFSSAQSSGTIRGGVIGHPGYNAQADEAAAIGNRSTDTSTINGVAIECHTYVGAGLTWTDYQAINNALAIARATTDPLIQMEPGNTSEGYSGVNAWVATGSAWDLVVAICARKRGRGVAWFDWNDDASESINAISVIIRTCPLFGSDSSYDDLSGTLTLHGAASSSRSLVIDLIGDRRLVPGSYTAATPTGSVYDQVIVEGEPIQVLVTLSKYDGTLSDGWTSADQSAWAALASDKRTDDRWRCVYQRFQLPRAFNGRTKNGFNVTEMSAFWYTDSGYALVDDATGAKTSPLLVRVLHDLPVLEGYTYTGATPAKLSGSGTTTETAQPERKPAAVWVRSSSSDKWWPGSDSSYGLHLRIGQDGLWISNASDESDGVRTIESVTPDKVAITVAIELPHRATYQTGGTGARIKRISLPGHHLWLATSGAIWDIDASSATSDGCTPRRDACASGGNILRDDRNKLARAGEMAWRYYGYAEGGKRTASWSLRCCGLGGSFDTYDETGHGPTPVEFPKLGYFVSRIKAGGASWVINTNITAIAYDNATQTTTWQTDWHDLDFTS